MNFIDDIKTFLNPIKEALMAFIEKVKGIVKKIIAKIVDFKNQVVGWIKQHPLIKGKEVPFLMNKKGFGQMLKDAPTVHIPDLFGEEEVGLFEGIYDELADEITDLRYIAADEYDEKTKQVLGNEELVVLT